MKKGFFFSFFVITALALIVLTFKIQIQFKEEQKSDIIKNRIERTNLFVEDVEKDIERSLYVAAFRALLGADEYIHLTHNYIHNATAAIHSLMLNGTINGTSVRIANTSNFGEWMQKVRYLAEGLNINITFYNAKIGIQQIDHWNLNISLTVDVEVIDFDRTLGWNFSVTEHTTIDIVDANLPDPMYFIESLDNYETNSGNSTGTPLTNSFRRSPYTTWWNNETGLVFPENINITFLQDHATKQYYTNSTEGPSYLMRLQGEFDCIEFATECNDFGIESFVNTMNTTSIWLYSEENRVTCAVDHSFFTEDCEASARIHTIYNMPASFVIDLPHLLQYGLRNINST